MPRSVLQLSRAALPTVSAPWRSTLRHSADRLLSRVTRVVPSRARRRHDDVRVVAQPVGTPGETVTRIGPFQAPEPGFTVTVDLPARRLVVAGEFDVAAVASFTAIASAVIIERPGDLTVDLAALRFIDAAGLGALVRLRNDLAYDGHGLRLEAVPAARRRVFAVAGLAGLLPGAE